MIQDFLDDADQVEQAEKDRGSDYATQVSVNQLQR